MQKIISDLFTENDGVTVCPGRVLLFAGAIVFFILACYTVVWLGESFNAMQFGTGYGTIIGAGTAAIGYKARTDNP